MYRALHYAMGNWSTLFGRGDKVDLPWLVGFYSPGRYLSRKGVSRSCCPPAWRHRTAPDSILALRHQCKNASVVPLHFG